jgi:transposase
MLERRKYTQEFKESAVELVRRGDRSVSAIARDLDIHTSTLCRWAGAKRAEEETGYIKAFPGSGKPRDEELAQLRKEVADLRETNEILKKAMVIFAEKKPR